MLDKSPVWGPGKGPSSCNNTSSFAICQDAYQWTCRRDGCRSPPPTSLAPPEQISNKQAILPWEESGTVTNKPFPLLQSPNGPRVPNSKEYTLTGGKGGSWDPHPLLTQSRARCSFRGQFPSLNRKQKQAVSKWGGTGQVPASSKFCSCCNSNVVLATCL